MEPSRVTGSPPLTGIRNVQSDPVIFAWSLVRWQWWRVFLCGVNFCNPFLILINTTSTRNFATMSIDFKKPTPNELYAYLGYSYKGHNAPDLHMEAQVFRVAWEKSSGKKNKRFPGSRVNPEARMFPTNALFPYKQPIRPFNKPRTDFVLLRLNLVRKVS